MADVKPWVKYGGPDTSQGTPTQGPWSKYQSGEKAPSGVYVKPAEGLSQQAIAGVYSFLEGASSATRGAAQWLQEKFPGLEEHMPDAFKKSTIEEEVRGRKALEQSKEYGITSKVASAGGMIADPLTYAIPLGKASSVGQFVKQSVAMGAGLGYIGAKLPDEKRSTNAAEGGVAGAFGGTILGSVMHFGGKLFGKDWLPWRATPEEQKTVEEEVLKTVPEDQKEAAREDLNHFMNASEDAHINAKKTADELISSGASKKKVEAARKKNKLVGHYIDEYQNRYEGLKGSKLGDTKQGEVLPPETPSGKPSGEILQGTTIEGEPAGKTTSSGFLGDEEGSISPRLAATMGGAAGGAMLDQKDPLEGALLGAATMHGGARAIEKFGGISIGEKLLNKLRGEEQNSVIKEAEGMVVSSLNDIRARERLAHVTSEKVKTLVPDAMERTKITQAMEHPELVKTLPAKAQQAYHELKKAFTDIGQRATDAQVIKGMLENYITHIVDWKRSPTKVEEALDYFLGTGVGKSAPGKTSSSFGKQRTYETIEDLNKALQGRGLQLKTTDPSEILKLYASSMEKAIAGKNLVTRLKDMVIPEVGKILLPLKKNFLPQGWKTSKSLFLQGYGIHPELAPILEHMFASNDPSAIFRATVALSNFTKRLNVAGSLFHVKSLTEALLSSGFKTFGKELTTGFSGTREALKAFKEGGFGDAADNWIKSGLILETPIDVDRQALGHIAGIVDDLASKAGIKSPLEMGAKWLEQNTLGKFDKLTWDFAHTGFKLLTAEKLLAKAKLDHPSVPETELRKEIVNYVNNSFGGLNWSQIASDSSSQVLRGLITPQGRQGLNILMFAPDWTTATIRAFTSAFGKNSGLKGLVAPRYTADFARQYQARTILLYFTLANGINMAMSGHPIWKNKDKTRVEFKDGTTMQLSKHAMEPYEWMQHPEQTLANKMGFLPHAAIIYWGEKQYPFGPDLEDKSSMGKMKQIMGQGIPFQAQSAMQAPKGEGIQRFISGSLGVPIYGKTEAQKKEDRKRLQQIKRENIKKWKEQNK